MKTDRQLVGFIIDHHEGSAFTDDPQDRGGATRYGVTKRLFDEYMGREMPIEALKALTRDQAIDILHAEFCFKPKLTAIHDARVKLCAVDFAIHSGPAHAIKSVQWAIGGIDVDGEWGPQTQTAMNTADATVVHRRMLAFRLRFLSELMRKDRSQIKFRGWWNRIANLLELPETL